MISSVHCPVNLKHTMSTFCLPGALGIAHVVMIPPDLVVATSLARRSGPRLIVVLPPEMSSGSCPMRYNVGLGWVKTTFVNVRINGDW